MSSISDQIQHLASQTLRKTLQTVPLGVSRSISSGTLPIFIFHAVESSPKPYIRHLYDCHSPQSFERVLDEILKEFKPLEDLSPAGIANAGADRFLVTFDDGLRSSYEWPHRFWSARAFPPFTSLSPTSWREPPVRGWRRSSRPACSSSGSRASQRRNGKTCRRSCPDVATPGGWTRR